MRKMFYQKLQEETETLKREGLYKEERVITSPQQAVVRLENGHEVINLCANNYLGLSNSYELEQVAKEALTQYGFGMSSVRFICGTQNIHKTLEARISQFVGMDDAILYSSCFDANGGLFETILGPEDAVISDALNHASIIDGIRLCKAQRYRYSNNDMGDLEEKLKEAQNARYRLIATDGVFSMDGTMANLNAICDLADRYDALVMVDDSHATGFVGKHGQGTHELAGCMGRIDIITSTFGKALGGASGGFTAGKRELIGWLRQRSRPYLFSNSLMPAICATTIEALNLVESGDDLRQKLHENSSYFRRHMEAIGYNIVPGSHPIIPIMIGDAQKAQHMAKRLLEEGVYVVSFSYPVVPQGQARIRTQMSAGHTREHLDRAIAAFKKVKS
ncbi:MAG: glycine C-acetyltransferase [Verrucomicrobia bacterium]|nr:glycine C-acetyltransferase [Verrucomicrobiota bacterium]